MRSHFVSFSNLIVDFITDPCRRLVTNSTYSMADNSCITYWKCVNGSSVGKCCPPGSAYVAGDRCMEGQPCNQTCPLEGESTTEGMFHYVSCQFCFLYTRLK